VKKKVMKIVKRKKRMKKGPGLGPDPLNDEFWWWSLELNLGDAGV
jgi:hypothetical protein